ncbi:response regulator [Desulfococcaceae bacterium HSG8]|nr:response regulator [Desulfococcaceae bacterium HSG8]
MEKQVKKRVLVAEDDPGILEFHQNILSVKYEVTTAANGEEAWKIFQKTPFSVIVTDIDMPVMDGNDLIRNVISKKPETQIVIVSSVTKAAVALWSTKNNITYLPKPVEFAYINIAVSSAFPRYQEQKWLNEMKKLIAKAPFWIKEC